ncbi:hypothetical protein PM082_020032 [Marasmius tenuissimus]|nr:hypothetical protein PM082_020032 [Marasmius tenuissimus]
MFDGQDIDQTLAAGGEARVAEWRALHRDTEHIVTCHSRPGAVVDGGAHCNLILTASTTDL